MAFSAGDISPVQRVTGIEGQWSKRLGFRVHGLVRVSRLSMVRVMASFMVSISVWSAQVFGVTLATPVIVISAHAIWYCKTSRLILCC